MNANSTTATESPPDPAAIFAAARSLYDACHELAFSQPYRKANFNLSEAYDGIDQLMREIMRIAQDFEQWSCAHVDFEQLSEVWPYFLEEHFGPACLQILDLSNLAYYTDLHSQKIAAHLNIPLLARPMLLVPRA